MGAPAQRIERPDVFWLVSPCHSTSFDFSSGVGVGGGGGKGTRDFVTGSPKGGRLARAPVYQLETCFLVGVYTNVSWSRLYRRVVGVVPIRVDFLNLR